MYEIIPFKFNNVDLETVTVDGKPWTRAKEICAALEYKKATRRVVRHHCSSRNIQHKHQLRIVPLVGAPHKWPKNSQKLDLYINEEGMYELLI